MLKIRADNGNAVYQAQYLYRILRAHLRAGIPETRNENLEERMEWLEERLDKSSLCEKFKRLATDPQALTLSPDDQREFKRIIDDILFLGLNEFAIPKLPFKKLMEDYTAYAAAAIASSDREAHQGSFRTGRL